MGSFGWAVTGAPEIDKTGSEGAFLDKFSDAFLAPPGTRAAKPTEKSGPKRDLERRTMKEYLNLNL